MRSPTGLLNPRKTHASQAECKWAMERKLKLKPNRRRRNETNGGLKAVDAVITKLTPTRIPELLKLIRELAKFERLEHEMEATVESLHDSLFGPQPVAGALLADCDGKPVGYSIYYFTFSSFVGRRGLWLEDVYVRPKFRSEGLGRRLIEAVARIGAERNCGRFEWTALNWNRKALDFYLGLGARTMDEWVLLRLNAGELRRLAASPPKKKTARANRARASS
jgi:GNAT superfamily N-acetyltransferase